ncbi:heterokaryon incompatibility protein-domain-containing protein [Lophiotrema nucula]|uniref:Heterokaryon incompatibility protein-domain-containing protein n=1 Tax=Lophiotrema nucula TaxID=690887 RepID=A0A6A5Z1C9_9PLEO|nr:heterokaryon incompatibility protein-domain-containing protein [Lophiotrema nucula]
MSWNSLPRTFQDAVFITRKLGLKYLWIDSRCILQDDDADWDLQLAQMGDICNKSYLTLAAVSAIDDQAGFLGFRDAGIPLEIEGDPRIPSNIRLRRAYERTQGPLDTRAWAFQERILSPRTLSFCVEEMTWDSQRCFLDRVRRRSASAQSC